MHTSAQRGAQYMRSMLSNLTKYTIPNETKEHMLQCVSTDRSPLPGSGIRPG